jgi:hypothetical protein
MFRWRQTAAVFAVVGPADAAELSLQRIMLSSGGVGYLEYEAVVAVFGRKWDQGDSARSPLTRAKPIS